MAFSKTLILLLPLFLLLATHKVVSEGDTTSFSSSENSLTYQGDAFVPFVRLTKTNSAGAPERNSIGRLVYSNPETFWAPGLQASFETTVRFIVTPLAGQTSNIGDGFNFFILPLNSPIPPGSVDGGLGLFISVGTPTTTTTSESTSTPETSPGSTRGDRAHKLSLRSWYFTSTLVYDTNSLDEPHIRHACMCYANNNDSQNRAC